MQGSTTDYLGGGRWHQEPWRDHNQVQVTGEMLEPRQGEETGQSVLDCKHPVGVTA